MMEPSAPSSPQRECRRCPHSRPMNGRAVISGFISSTKSPGKPNRSPVSTRSRPTPTQCARPSTHCCSGRWRGRCRRGFRATRAALAASSLAQAVQRIEASSKTGDRRPAWQRALANARLPLYDVHWTPAVLVKKPSGKKSAAWRVGLPDGRVLPLAIDNAAAQRKLMLYDVLLVRVAEGKGKADTRAELRVRPVVQGAVVVRASRPRRLLPITGGFSGLL